MHPSLLRLFQFQILTQCEFMILAAHELESARITQDGTRLFYAIQNILNAAANISKALWGLRGAKSDARRELRQNLGVLDDSPLRQVTMRNNFEHFDERLDRWWAESPRHNSFDMWIGQREAIVGVDDIDRFRMYDAQTGNVTFWSEDFSIQAIIAAAVELRPRVLTELQKRSSIGPDESPREQD